MTDDLIFPKRRGRKDNEKDSKEGKLKERWGETEGGEREGKESKEQGISQHRGVSVLGSSLHLPQSSSSPQLPL